jgi:hypothetical protein
MPDGMLEYAYGDLRYVYTHVVERRRVRRLVLIIYLLLRYFGRFVLFIHYLLSFIIYCTLLVGGDCGHRTGDAKSFTEY